jgi:hypothetical protein
MRFSSRPVASWSRESERSVLRGKDAVSGCRRCSGAPRKPNIARLAGARPHDPSAGLERLPASEFAQATLVRHFKYAMTASMRERTWSF